MDGTFIEALDKALAVPTCETVDGKERLLAPADWHDFTPKQPQVSPLKVHTLTGFVGYIQVNVDHLPLEECLVHVVDPSSVWLRAKMEPEAAEYRRHGYVQATTELLVKPFPFGQYLDSESFFIGLSSQFVQTSERDALAALLRSIRESTVRETTDDGVSQHVNVAQGITKIGDAAIPNPVTLRPFRTFLEVEQPDSQFVLRLRSGKEGEKPSMMLVEADGGGWRLEAVTRIAAYLTEALGDTVKVVG